MMNSKAYYDQIVSHYDQISEKKDRFLIGIERIILESMAKVVINRYLDIGCGNGIRSNRIIRALNPGRSVLLDESHKMIEQVRKIVDDSTDVIESNFLNFYTKDRFSLITCLWNVLGHLDSRDTRLDFLRKIYELLGEDGTVFIDVNNRYNMQYYGVSNVLHNITRDLLTKSGAGLFQLKFSGDVSHVYIHHPFELDGIISKAGFSRFKKFYVDYDTGVSKRSFFSGQILYQLHK